jgi:hypothetical protein
MVESAAHLVNHVFPELPVRQFVLTFPFLLRFLIASQPEALTALLALVQRALSAFEIRHSDLVVSWGARTGAVTLIQRVGAAHRRWLAVASQKSTPNELLRRSGAIIQVLAA